ncbi:FxLYD domain-containing protein [Kribbella soli]|uniref:Lipoprotein n=1 Tax=Kribbella soli TaxID=1124743 RepID=A0A4R0HB61_9ACTN|nr:FxLYD domain-containing protein [Kribbella soli]TCC04959.1 hypothetical protein E0H45_23035 [Kribbella soli]
MKKYIVGLAVVPFVLMGCTATDSGSEPGATKTAAKNRTDPVAVAVGKPFTIGKHRLDAGWKLAYQQYLGAKVTGTVTNTSKKTSTAIFTIKFLKATTVVGNMSCVSNELEPGQSQAIECLNGVAGDVNLKGKYDKVTAEADF